MEKEPMTEQDFNWYYHDIPTTKEKARSRKILSAIWGVSDRTVRNIIQKLRMIDNGDDMVVVSSSHEGGYYKTNDREVIKAFYKETNHRALAIFGPLKKVNRILGTSAEQLELFKENIL